MYEYLGSCSTPFASFFEQCILKEVDGASWYEVRSIFALAALALSATEALK